MWVNTAPTLSLPVSSSDAPNHHDHGWIVHFAAVLQRIGERQDLGPYCFEHPFEDSFKLSACPCCQSTKVRTQVSWKKCNLLMAALAFTHVLHIYVWECGFVNGSADRLEMPIFDAP